MKTYSYKGREYIESGEVRMPSVGEIYMQHSEIAGAEPCEFRDTSGLRLDLDEGRRKILIPKEQKVSEGQDEYQIPVLVKAAMDQAGYRDDIRALAGKIIMCREVDGFFYSREGGRNGDECWNSGQVVTTYPSQAQVEAERAKLAPKPDTLPAPVRAALEAENRDVCTGARKYVRELVEAMYANPPRATP